MSRFWSRSFLNGSFSRLDVEMPGVIDIKQRKRTKAETAEKTGETQRAQADEEHEKQIENSKNGPVFR